MTDSEIVEAAKHESSTLLSLPALTELEKLLLTNEIQVNKEVLEQITQQPMPPDNYSVLDNIYRCLTITKIDLTSTLRTLHRELVNTMNAANTISANSVSSSTNTNTNYRLSGIGCLPCELLPIIVDYGHGDFAETVVNLRNKFGTPITRFVKDVQGNQIAHGPQSQTYVSSSKLSRILVVHGKTILAETVKKSATGFTTFSIGFASTSRYDQRGYLGLNEQDGSDTGTIGFHRFNEPPIPVDSFPIIRPNRSLHISSDLSQPKFVQFVHLDLARIE